MMSAVFGGTVPDLKEIYHMDSGGIAQIIVSRSAGILIGRNTHIPLNCFGTTQRIKFNVYIPFKSVIHLEFRSPGAILCGGYLFQRMNAKIVIILALIFGGLGTAILPDVAPYYWIAHIGLFVAGFSVGALEVGQREPDSIKRWQRRRFPLPNFSMTESLRCFSSLTLT